MLNKEKRVAVVIPNWNGADFISDCINSLLNQDSPCQVIVVDNGSIDQSIEILEDYGDDITLIKNRKNYGFAEGVNIGIRYALDNKYDFIALLNNDAVADRRWVNSLLSFMVREPNAGIVTSRLTSFDRLKLDSTGDFYTRWGLPYPRGRGESASGTYTVSEEVFGASGGASIYRSSMLRQIGLFDKFFFAYFEDVDISYRARIYGWKIFYCADAIAYHHISATSSRLKGFTIFHTYKNYPLVFVKNTPFPLLVKSLPFIIIAYTGLILNSIKKGRGRYALKGFLSAIILLPYALWSRINIQKNRKVTSKEIESWVTFEVPQDQTGIIKLKNLLHL